MPSLSVRCPRCQTVFKVDASLAGQATNCTHCGQGMVVPTPGPPPVANAPPLVNPPPVAKPAPTPDVVAPRVRVTASEPKPKPVSTAPRRVLTDKEKAAATFRANLIMLVFGMIVLTVTMLVLLYLTDSAQSP